MLNKSLEWNYPTNIVLSLIANQLTPIS